MRIQGVISAILIATSLPLITATRVAWPAPDPVEAGRALFEDASLSGNGKVACATCHPRAGHTDNRTYAGPAAVADGTPEGRSTPLLWGARDTAPYTWAGGRTLKEAIRDVIVTRMQGKEPTEAQVDRLAAYVLSLEFPRNDRLAADGSPAASAPEAAKRGYQVFLKASCNICHDPPVFSKPDNEDIGSGGSFSVPSLRGVSGTAPYFHDGRFPTLRVLVPAKLELLKALGVTDALSEKEIDDLIAFLGIL